MITVSFDYDGVLARSPFANGVLFPVLDELAGALASRDGKATETAREEVRELIWRESWRRTAAGNWVEAYDWQQIVAVVADGLELEFKASLPDMTKDFRETLNRNRDRSLVYPHVRETLQWLRESEVCLLLLTNGYRAYQLPTLEGLGLAKFFGNIFASDDLGSVKPAPEAFRIAFAACGNGDGGGKERYHVGDSLTQDVAGARGFGVTAVWVHRELPEAIAGLSPRRRAEHPELEAVLEAKLVKERRGIMASDGISDDVARENLQPDAVIASLDELRLVLAGD